MILFAGKKPRRDPQDSTGRKPPRRLMLTALLAKVDIAASCSGALNVPKKIFWIHSTFNLKRGSCFSRTIITVTYGEMNSSVGKWTETDLQGP